MVSAPPLLRRGTNFFPNCYLRGESRISHVFAHGWLESFFEHWIKIFVVPVYWLGKSIHECLIIIILLLSLHISIKSEISICLHTGCFDRKSKQFSATQSSLKWFSRYIYCRKRWYNLRGDKDRQLEDFKGGLWAQGGPSILVNV